MKEPRPHATIEQLFESGKSAISVKERYGLLQIDYQFNLYCLNIAFAAENLCEFNITPHWKAQAESAKFKTELSDGSTLWVSENEYNIFYFAVSSFGQIFTSLENK